MSTVQHTSTAIMACIDTQRLELRIHSEGARFKVIPKGNSTAWRELNNLLYPGQPVKESIPLSATGVLAAEVELRKLLAEFSEVKVEEPTYFRYTKGRTRFTIEAKPHKDTALTVKTTDGGSNGDDYEARLNSFIVALGLSPLCRSVKLFGGTIFISLAPRYSTDKRLATYEALVDLHE